MSEGTSAYRHLTPRRDWFGLSTPIGVIGAFTALSEIAMIVGAIFTDDGVQWVLAIFAVLFPIMIASPFFWILYHRNYVLYPPKEYGGETGVLAYVEAMTRHPGALVDLESLEERVKEILTSEEMVQSISQAIPETSTNVERQQAEEAIAESLDTAASRVLREIVERGVVSITGQEPGSRYRATVSMKYDPEMSVGTFLDYVASHLVRDDDISAVDLHPSRRRMEAAFRMAEQYGATWVLWDTESHEVYESIGPRWAKHVGTPTDERTISQVGITSGDHLEIMWRSTNLQP